MSTSEGWRAWLGRNRRPLAGVVLILASVQFALVLVVGASLVPGYRVHADTISRLGVASETARLFNTSVLLAGVANIAAGWLLYREHRTAWLFGVFVLAGLGAIGVGVFPATTGTPHVVGATTAFVFFNVEGIACGLRIGGPLGWLGGIAGFIGLCFLALFVAGGGLLVDGGFGMLGVGGVERLVVYPVYLWLIAFGGFNLGDSGRR